MSSQERISAARLAFDDSMCVSTDTAVKLRWISQGADRVYILETTPPELSECRKDNYQATLDRISRAQSTNTYGIWQERYRGNALDFTIEDLPRNYNYSHFFFARVRVEHGNRTECSDVRIVFLTRGVSRDIVLHFVLGTVFCWLSWPIFLLQSIGIVLFQGGSSRSLHISHFGRLIHCDLLNGIPQDIAKVFMAFRMHMAVGALITCFILSFIIPIELASYNSERTALEINVFPSVVLFVVLLSCLLCARTTSILFDRKWTKVHHANRHQSLYVAWGDKRSSSNILSLIALFWTTMQLIGLVVSLVPEEKLLGSNPRHQETVQRLLGLVAALEIRFESITDSFHLAVVLVLLWLVLFSSVGTVLLMTASDASNQTSRQSPLIEELEIRNARARFSVLSSFPCQLSLVLFGKVGFIFILTSLMNLMNCNYNYDAPKYMCFPERCENTCPSSHNEVCEDGGSVKCDKGEFSCKRAWNYASRDCDLGTDCDDCGNRGGITVNSTVPKFQCRGIEYSEDTCCKSNYNLFGAQCFPTAEESAACCSSMPLNMSTCSTLYTWHEKYSLCCNTTVNDEWVRWRSAVEVWGTQYDGRSGELLESASELVDDREYQVKVDGVPGIQIRLGKNLKKKHSSWQPIIDAFDDECIIALPYACHNISKRQIVLHSDPEWACWDFDHRPYAVCSFLCLMFYVPTAIFFVPSMLAHSDGYFPHATNDLRVPATFQVFDNILALLAVGSRQFVGSWAPEVGIALLISLYAIMIALLECMKPYSAPTMNVVHSCLYLFAVFSSLSVCVAYLDQDWLMLGAGFTSMLVIVGIFMIRLSRTNVPKPQVTANRRRSVDSSKSRTNSMPAAIDTSAEVQQSAQPAPCTDSPPADQGKKELGMPFYSSPENSEDQTSSSPNRLGILSAQRRRELSAVQREIESSRSSKQFDQRHNDRRERIALESMYQRGERVQVHWHGKWLQGQICRVEVDGTYDVFLQENQHTWEVNGVSVSRIRQDSIPGTNSDHEIDLAKKRFAAIARAGSDTRNEFSGSMQSSDMASARSRLGQVASGRYQYHSRGTQSFHDDDSQNKWSTETHSRDVRMKTTKVVV